MNLQPVSSGSAPLLAAIHKAAFISHVDWDEDFFQKLLVLPTTRGLTAAEADEPLGFILWQQTAESGEIITVAVLPKVQRRGIGKQLLSAYEVQLQQQQIACSLLDVAADNDAAIALYQQAGYQQIHLRPRYYQLYEGGMERRVDALVLQKLF